MKYFIWFLFLSLTSWPFLVGADFASSTNFQIPKSVISVGGGNSTSTSFSGEGSIGQPATGISTSTSFMLKGGFLYFDQGPVVVPTSTPAPTSTPTSTSSGNSGGGGGGIILNFLEKIFPFLKNDSCTISGVDLNQDGRVNIVDLSILVFNYGKEGSSVCRYDFNKNSEIDFPDVSIMMFYWTG